MLLFHIIQGKKTMKNILIVENDVISSHYLKSILRSLKYKNIFEVSCAKDSLDVIKTNKIDLVFMDINLSGPIDGITCAHMMNDHGSFPIIFTTAHSDSLTILEASSTNLYGFLIKPFESSHVEVSLVLAIKRLTNIYKNISLPKINKKNVLVTIGEKHIYDLYTKTLCIDGIPVNLTKKELDILCVLCININLNVSFLTIKDIVWSDKNISNSTIRDTILRLRKKAPKLNIESISGFGYILKAA